MKRPRIWIPFLASTGWIRRDGKGGTIRLWPGGPGWSWTRKTGRLRGRYLARRQEAR